MPRISSAFRSFFSILFGGTLPEDIAREFGYSKAPAAPLVEAPDARDGALQILALLQRDSRLIDFLMEDISTYSDEQVGAAVRALHGDCRASLERHVALAPVIDAVEGGFQKLDASQAPDPNRIKLLGNVPANGRSGGGILRHRGWTATSVNLPAPGKRDLTVIAPAEIEVE